MLVNKNNVLVSVSTPSLWMPSVAPVENYSEAKAWVPRALKSSCENRTARVSTSTKWSTPELGGVVGGCGDGVKCRW